MTQASRRSGNRHRGRSRGRRTAGCERYDARGGSWIGPKACRYACRKPGRRQTHAAGKSAGWGNRDGGISAAALGNAQTGRRSRQRIVRTRRRRWQHAIARRVGKLQLNGIRGSVGHIASLLGIANVADLAIIHVIPGKRRRKRRRDSHIRIRQRFHQFMAGHRRVIAKRGGRTATGGATAARLHVRQNAVKNMLGVQRARRGAVISAESASHAA